MVETIKKIEEVDNVKVKGLYGDNAGYKITTDKREIFLLISDDQCCCENFGYLTTVEDTSEYIGAQLLNITQVHNTDLYDVECEYDVKDAMFLNLETDMGTLDFVVYNEHNGYYGHPAVFVIDDEVIESEVL